MGHAQGINHGGPSTDLGVSVVLGKHVENVVTELLCDLRRVGNAIVLGSGDVESLAILNEELGEGCRRKLGHNAMVPSQLLARGVSLSQRETHVNTRLVSTVLPAP